MKSKRIPGNPAGSKLWRSLPQKRPDDPEFIKMLEQHKIEKQQRRGNGKSL